MKKIQITLTDNEAELLMLKANTFGYSLPKMVKFLISEETSRIIEKLSSVTSPKNQRSTTSPHTQSLSSILADGRAEYKAGQAKPFDDFLEEIDQA